MYVQKICNSLCSRFLKKYVQGLLLEADLHQRDQRVLFRRLKCLSIEYTRKVSSQHIHDEEERILRDPGRIKERWAWQREICQAQTRRHRRVSHLACNNTRSRGQPDTKKGIITVLRSMANTKAVGPDELLVELLKIGPNHDPIVLQEFHRVFKLV